AWLHPRASVFDHRARCRGRPWVDVVAEVAVIPFEYTARIARVVDASLLGTVSDPGESWAVPGDGRAKRMTHPAGGLLTLETPIAGVRPRRWLAVAMAAIERFGDEGLGRALDADEFHRLEAEVLVPGAHVECICCGAFIAARRQKAHQATNAACLWRNGAAEVRRAWADGWRDPNSVPDAPMTWSELQATAAWRHRVRTVRFPRWIAVLLAPPES
ncbi:MAG TPA: hypothetical protein VI916_14885, partial [Acidimicrobiia bacterium]|nr:hypothetical protein [Acidimicrobiia bacterium]